MTKEQKLAEAHRRLESACQRSQRPVSAVKLIGISKTKPVSDILEFFQLGLDHFGENYLQEALPKVTEVAAKLTNSSRKPQWHYIGQLQSNKAKHIPGNFAWLHSLDSISSAKKLSAAAEEKGLSQKCLIQVNIENEPTKAGVAAVDLPKLLESFAPLSGIQVHGLMCIPNPSLERDIRIPFSSLRSLLEQVNRSGCYPLKLEELSMGMSEDFESAIEEGSTFVRVGTALFGERVP
jgi:pyridoxal phosphate enzyme (YggS family)